MTHSCVLCQSKTQSFQHPKFNILFHECPHCGLITKDESSYINETDERDVYLQHENTLDNTGYVNYLTNFIEQAVIPFIQKGDALDYGSGPNPVLAYLMKNHFQFDVDIYDYFFSPLKVFENKTYELITSTEVVEHLRNPREVFELFSKHLKPKGILSIMTLFYPIDKEIFYQWHYIRDPSHVSFYSIKTMEYIASQFGFKLLFHNNYRVAVFQK
ncbi:MAG: class I SAM-dependent methyltransferase [Acholeplasmataceae bacterium]|jgi:hypothetical protein|nr:class I SAM-dependent methyltransferase [Acholeplasmataceae bacterium]